MSTNDDHPAHDPETLAAKVLGQDVGRAGHVGVLLRGVLGTDEEGRGQYGEKPWAKGTASDGGRPSNHQDRRLD